MIGGFVRALQPEIVVETGSAFGFGSEAIGRALQANGHGRLYSLEVNPERVQIARRRVAGLPVDIVEGDSLEFTPPGEVGFAFFDSYPELRADEFRRYLPSMRPMTVVAFHDAAPHHAVWPSIEKLEEEGLLKAFRIRSPRGLAIAQITNGHRGV